MEGGEINRQENEILLGISEDLHRQNLSTPDLLQAIQDKIVNHSQSMEHPHETKDILESRFTPPEEAYKRGMTSCGAMTNIGAFLLRDLGYEVRLIDGLLPELRSHHAWLEIKEADGWKEYDLTAKGCAPREGRVIENRCNNWDEIKDILENKHKVGVQISGLSIK